MNILPVSDNVGHLNANFGKKTSESAFERKFANYGSDDIFVSQKRSVMNQIKNYLTSVGIEANIRRDECLEISNLSKLPKEANPITDLMLQFTKKINGSVDFGKIGASTLGAVEELKGGKFNNRRFDISKSKIESIGRLKKVDGSLVISPKQLRDIDFEGLEVSDDIIIADKNDFGMYTYKPLDKFDKAAVLGGFELLHY